MEGESSDIDGMTVLTKEGCEVAVENLIVAIDCDACDAFTENDTRPDIVSVRHCGERFGWLIIEMKSRMRLQAAKQAVAALERLGQHPMFSICLEDVHVVFVVKNKRRAANTIMRMREIGRIDIGRWRVVPRLVGSGDSVECPHR
jgi:hypothetical protein